MTTELAWSDPPASTTGRRHRPALDWDAIAAELEARPGQWALVAAGASQSLGAQESLRRGLERTTRVVPGSVPRVADIYVRQPAQ
jgi:hypothetical protein